jgi:Mrp family chromosome partitioning ATPase
MSRNFELMQQMGRAFEVVSIPQPGRAGSEAAPIPAFQPSRVSEAASIPAFQPSRVSSDAKQKVRRNGVRFDLGHVAREETLRLVQRIFLLQTQKAPRVVMFAGINQGAGCSQICLLVAETLESAISGSVCVVEANFRSPSLPGLLGTTNHYGLTDALLHEGPIRSFARPLDAGNIWFLSCGSLAADSPNLLSSDRIKTRFDELRREFDYVLVDVPCLARYADATVLGRVTDGVVLVLEANATRKESALTVAENLRAAQINVLGAVLNKRTFPIPALLYNRL